MRFLRVARDFIHAVSGVALVSALFTLNDLRSICFSKCLFYNILRLAPEFEFQQGGGHGVGIPYTKSRLKIATNRLSQKNLDFNQLSINILKNSPNTRLQLGKQPARLKNRIKIRSPPNPKRAVCALSSRMMTRW
jgi:hypothetical protein